MPENTDETSKLKAFQDAAQSLRLYRRAELIGDEKGESLIDDLYVDPLPANQILKTILQPNTTFVIGRKGTGKSTIFQRLQSELRKQSRRTSAYPTCEVATVKVFNLSRKYERELLEIGGELLLPRTELGILQTLHAEKEPLRPSDIAAELDCSYQLIGWRGKHLAERNLVDRSENEQGNRILAITDLAKSSYFSHEKLEGLQVAESAEDQKETDPHQFLREESDGESRKS